MRGPLVRLGRAGIWGGCDRWLSVHNGLGYGSLWWVWHHRPSTVVLGAFLLGRFLPGISATGMAPGSSLSVVENTTILSNRGRVIIRGTALLHVTH